MKHFFTLAFLVLLASCTQQEQPFFQKRGVVVNTHDLSTVDWPKLAHENGINTIGTHMFPEEVVAFIRSEKGQTFLADCEKYGIDVEHQLHAMGDLLPRELFAEDSTMFRMNEAGRRVADCNLCVHSQKALDKVAEKALCYAKLLPATNHRYYFWIDDAQPMCHCPECSKYSDSEQALMVENRIIKELRTFDPKAQLAHLAYMNTLPAPRRVKPEEGIFLEYAPIKRTWDKPIDKAHLQELKDNLTVFPAETAEALEYWLDVSLFSKWTKPAVKLPWNKEVFESDVDTYASLGIRNITSFAVYIDDKYIEAYQDLNFLKEYGDGLKYYKNKPTETLCEAYQTKRQSRTSAWTKEQASRWQQQWGWLRGCNFTPSTAINQLEMWQAETFDPETIDRELGWAAAIGMNCMRVYLHHLAWEKDRSGFKKRMYQYMDIAERHGISTIFVFFDDCWNPVYEAGKQPEPKPGVHNSGWVRDPGKRLADHPELITLLEEYVTDVLTTFRDEKRIVLWDMYNEPGNRNSDEYSNRASGLLAKAFAWARAVNPSQPLSTGLWNIRYPDLCKEQAELSDVITFHEYGDPETLRTFIDAIKHNYGQPMICTEYMARTQNNTFQNIMPILKSENIGAINWGLVAGKTNTNFAWKTPLPDVVEPPVWFHDIFRKDGTPYSQEEIDVIKSLCK